MDVDDIDDILVALNKTENLSEIKKREEIKRWNAMDPVLRWRQIQAMITKIESQLPEEKRRNRPRWKS